MAILENRVRIPTFSSSLSFTIRQLSMLLRKLVAVIFVLLLFKTLYISPSERINMMLLEGTGYLLTKTIALRTTISDYLDNIKQKLSSPTELAIENTLLKLKIASLEKLQNNYLIALKENKNLKELLEITNHNARPITHAKIIHTTDNILSKTAIVAAGIKHGIKIDQVVCSQNGLIGRVISVSNNYAKVMLITDPNSRIPVISVNNGNKGILASDGEKLKLIYLQDEHNIELEDTIITSGDGSIYPAGIVVAKVKKTYKNEALLEPVSDFATNIFVTIYPSIPNQNEEKEFINSELVSKSQKTQVILK